MKKYNKLVRDKIPEIIKSQGRKVICRTLEKEEYKKALNEKLKEELKEYLEDNNPEELADIVEVIYALLDVTNISIEEFEKIRKNKIEKNGAFKNKILLESAEEKKTL